MEDRFLDIYDFLEESVINDDMDEEMANEILEAAYARYMDDYDEDDEYTAEDALNDIENDLFNESCQKPKRKGNRGRGDNYVINIITSRPGDDKDDEEDEDEYFSPQEYKDIKERFKFNSKALKMDLKETKAYIKQGDYKKASAKLLKCSASLANLKAVAKKLPDKIPEDYVKPLYMNFIGATLIFSGIKNAKDAVFDAAINTRHKNMDKSRAAKDAGKTLLGALKVGIGARAMKDPDADSAKLSMKIKDMKVSSLLAEINRFEKEILNLAAEIRKLENAEKIVRRQ